MIIDAGAITTNVVVIDGDRENGGSALILRCWETGAELRVGLELDPDLAWLIPALIGSDAKLTIHSNGPPHNGRWFLAIDGYNEYPLTGGREAIRLMSEPACVGGYAADREPPNPEDQFPFLL